MDGKMGTFLLGVIAAVVLVMLWRKESVGGSVSFDLGATSPGAGAPGGCNQCSHSPSMVAAPSAQAMLGIGTGTEGMISPGTPPLNAATGGQGGTSFYTSGPTGVTPDNSFTFMQVQRNASALGSPVQPDQGNVPGSPTTLAAVTPVRATQPVPSYYEQGFIPRYSVSGVYVH